MRHHVPIHARLGEVLKSAKPRRGRARGRVCRRQGRDYTSFLLHADLARFRATIEEPCLRWHALRHTFGSVATAAGVHPRVLQRWLGHSSLAMTDRYSHLAPGFRDRMDEI